MLDLVHYSQSANHVRKIADDLKMDDDTRVAAHRLFEQFLYLGRQDRQDDIAQGTLLERMDGLIRKSACARSGLQ